MSRFHWNRRFADLRLFAAVLLLAGAASAERVKDLQHAGAVNDFASVISAGDRQKLEQLSESAWQQQHAKISIVTVKSLDGVPIETFASDLFKQWGIGGKDDRGVLIVLAVHDRRYRVEVGYGLEPILPDGKVGGFGREIVPALKQRNYSVAMLQLAGRISQTVATDSPASTVARAPEPRTLLEQVPLDSKIVKAILVTVVVVVALGALSLVWLIFSTIARALLVMFGYKGPLLLKFLSLGHDKRGVDWGEFNRRTRSSQTSSSWSSSSSDSSSSSSSSSDSSSSSGYDGGSSGGGGASGDW